jgi:hypothetical protein
MKKNQEVIKLGTIRKKKISITPDTNIIESWRSGGREIEQSLSDLIDNSIDAGYTEDTYKKLYKKNVISIKWHSIPAKVNRNHEFSRYAGEEGWLISDQGSGILNPETCWVAGASKKKKSIGRFGIGLKNSTLELGNHIFIRTKNEGKTFATTIPFDCQAVQKKGDWNLDLQEREGLPKGDHFTKILITDCHIENPQFEEIFDRVSRTYYKMCGDNLQIFFEEKQLYWKEPEIFEIVDQPEVKKMYNIKAKKVKIFEDFDTKIIGGKNHHFKVSGYVGIQKEHDQNHDGIDIFLNGRLVEANSRIGVGVNRARIYGQVNVEQNFSVNYQKTKLDRKSAEYNRLNDYLMKMFDPVVEFARLILSNGRYKPPKSVERETRKIEDFLAKSVSLIFPELDELRNPSEIMEESTDDDSLDSGEIDKLIRKSIPDDLKKKLVRAIATNNRKRKSKETFRLPKSDSSIRIQHQAEELGEKQDYSTHYPRKINGTTLHIVSNASHPYYTEARKLGNKKIVALHQNQMIDELSRYFSIHTEISEKAIKDSIFREMARHDLKTIS